MARRALLPALLITLLSLPCDPARAADAPTPVANAAAGLLSSLGADTFTVELVRATKRAPDGSTDAAVTPALRAAMLEALDAYQFRLVGFDEVAGSVAAVAADAAGRRMTLSFPAEAAAERARVILKGYVDLLAAVAGPGGFGGGVAAAVLGVAVRAFLGGVKFVRKGTAVVVDLPDPAPLLAVMERLRAKAEAERPAPAEACRSNLRTIEGAAELFAMEKGDKAPPPDLPTLVKENYLRRSPVCPEGGTYSISKGKPPRCSKHGTADDVRGKGGAK